MKVLLISHSYIDRENQKNLLGLAKYLDVMAMVPTESDVLLARKVKFSAYSGAEKILCSLRTFRFFSGQYIFFGVGAARQFNPQVILVEYNPWSLVFIQAWIYRYLFFRDAILVCFIKKNTYRRYRGVLGFVKNALAKGCIRGVDFFLAGSQKAREMLQRECGIATDMVSVVGHLGVDTTWFRPGIDHGIRSRGVNVGYCGRFDRDKGVEEMVVAIRASRARTGLDIRLKLLGSGTLNASLRKLTEEEKWVSILPPVEHVKVVSFLNGLDLFLFLARASPDHEEHDAQALLEALACGIPCIGTRVGIIPEILSRGGGVLVNDGDMDELTDAVVKCVSNPSYQLELGLEGRDMVTKEFSIDAVAKRKADLLKSFKRGSH